MGIYFADKIVNFQLVYIAGKTEAYFIILTDIAYRTLLSSPIYSFYGNPLIIHTNNESLSHLFY